MPKFRKLYKSGVNWIAVSIDSLTQLQSYKELFQKIKENNMNVRVCLNLTDIIPVRYGFMDIFAEIEEGGNVKQLLVRNISIPSNVKSGPQFKWIKEHTSQKRFLEWGREFDEIIAKEKKKPIRVLSFDGTKVWGHNGISVVFSNYCIQETNNTDDVRSLIYLEDGHLYTSWSDLASILF